MQSFIDNCDNVKLLVSRLKAGTASEAFAPLRIQNQKGADILYKYEKVINFVTLLKVFIRNKSLIDYIRKEKPLKLVKSYSVFKD